jgi:tRNA (cmo5U34)-methyltransferase
MNDNNVGDNILAKPGSWKFSGDTVKGFDEHVMKSVPLYEEGHDLICDLAEFFVKDNSIIYDVGCSTGGLVLKLADRFSHKQNAHFIGVDVEHDMIECANKKKESVNSESEVEFICDDILNVEMQSSDLIVCYYSIQFISPSVRQSVIDKLYDRLNWGGALIIYEKTRGSDARFQDILTSLYTDYKLRRGFSPETIIAKSRSLKGVLEPFSLEGNIDLLKRAGFNDINLLQKYICFDGFIGIK